jgi:four helix bundle protein
MANYKELKVWRKADELAHLVYDLTEDFPANEEYRLISQLRRAAISIPANIVEGSNRKSKKGLYHSIDISLGSLAEVEYLLEFSRKRGYIEAGLDHAADVISELGKMLWGFQRSL